MKHGTIHGRERVIVTSRDEFRDIAIRSKTPVFVSQHYDAVPFKNPGKQFSHIERVVLFVYLVIDDSEHKAYEFRGPYIRRNVDGLFSLENTLLQDLRKIGVQIEPESNLYLWH